MNPSELTTVRPDGSLVRIRLPLLSSRVHAGFPSPAEDHEDCGLDLVDRFIRHPAASFFQRVGGDSMTGEGIRHGDYLLVDRSRDPRHGDVVVIEIDGDRVVRLFCHDRRAIRFEAAHPGHPPIPFGPGCAVIGVVTSVHRDLMRPG
jgi:DNA polymerase V